MKEKVYENFRKYSFHSFNLSNKNSIIRLLSVIQQDFIEMGIKTEIILDESKQNNFMLISENIEEVKTVVVTHYDRPKFSLKKEYVPSEESSLKREVFQAIIVSMLIFILLLIPFIFLLLKTAKEFPSYHIIFLILYFWLLLKYLNKFRLGIPKPLDLVRNISSLVALTCCFPQDSTVGVAILNFGCEDRHGLKKFMKKHPDKHVVYLDSVGDGSLQILHEGNFTLISPPVLENREISIDEAMYNVEKAAQEIRQVLIDLE